MCIYRSPQRQECHDDDWLEYLWNLKRHHLTGGDEPKEVMNNSEAVVNKVSLEHRYNLSKTIGQADVFLKD